MFIKLLIKLLLYLVNKMETQLLEPNNNNNNDNNYNNLIRTCAQSLYKFSYKFIFCVFVIIVISSGPILIYVGMNSFSPNWTDVPKNNCIIINTHIKANDINNDHMFSLVADYETIYQGERFVCSDVKKKSNSYGDLQQYALMKYPNGTQSKKCKFNEKTYKSTYGYVKKLNPPVLFLGSLTSFGVLVLIYNIIMGML